MLMVRVTYFNDDDYTTIEVDGKEVWSGLEINFGIDQLPLIFNAMGIKIDICERDGSYWMESMNEG